MSITKHTKITKNLQSNYIVPEESLENESNPCRFGIRGWLRDQHEQPRALESLFAGVSFDIFDIHFGPLLAFLPVVRESAEHPGKRIPNHQYLLGKRMAGHPRLWSGAHYRAVTQARKGDTGYQQITEAVLAAAKSVSR